MINVKSNKKDIIMFIIDLLYVSGCAGKEIALKNLDTALIEMGFTMKECLITEKEIKAEKEARLWKLAGSPTLKINGVDIIDGDKKYGLYPRSYGSNNAAPTVDEIKRSLRMDIRLRAGMRDSDGRKPRKGRKCLAVQHG